MNGFKRREYEGIVYEHCVSGKCRGEVRILKPVKMVIPRFPHIKRIFSLETGFKRFRSGKAWVEEKVDGYNVRVVYVDGRVLGFTRGGILCPFTYEKLNREKRLVEFLQENPNIIVNGEMAGPNNPYITQSPGYVKRDVKFFVFDMTGPSGFLDVETRNDLVKDYKLVSVRNFGYLDLGGIKEVVMENYKEMEGIVLKSKDRKIAVKYVFPDSDIDDIRVTARIFPEVKAGYFLQRIVRTSMFLEENKLDLERYRKMLGSAFLDEMVNLVSRIKSGEGVYEDFEIIVENPKTAYDLVKLLSENVKVDVVDIKKSGKAYKIKIRKFYPDATRYWRERVHGKAFID